MCAPPKPPPPPTPPPPPSTADANSQALADQQRLARRQGYAASIKTSSQGAAGFNRSVSVPGLSRGTATVTGVGA